MVIHDHSCRLVGYLLVCSRTGFIGSQSVASILTPVIYNGSNDAIEDSKLLPRANE